MANDCLEHGKCGSLEYAIVFATRKRCGEDKRIFALPKRDN